jgi:hypothetical protein
MIPTLDTLKYCLLETHNLSDPEKLDVLYKSEPLGGRKPSQVLANMLAYCLAGMEQTVMFQYMFLQLPVTLRTLLGEQKPGDIGGVESRFYEDGGGGNHLLVQQSLSISSLSG